jgi:hypothetical protein
MKRGICSGIEWEAKKEEGHGAQHQSRAEVMECGA